MLVLARFPHTLCRSTISSTSLADPPRSLSTASPTASRVSVYNKDQTMTAKSARPWRSSAAETAGHTGRTEFSSGTALLRSTAP